MVFKCSEKYEVCTYNQFVSNLSQFKQYIQEFALLDHFISDDASIDKNNCVFLQFQINYNFSELFICPLGSDSETESEKLKIILNSS